MNTTLGGGGVTTEGSGVALGGRAPSPAPGGGGSGGSGFGGEGGDRSVDTSCVYQGQSYVDGSRFDASDGCNVCTCASGELSCTEDDVLCTSCSVGGQCPEGTYCELHDGVCVGDGSCALVPDGCATQGAVCGCDGVTYESECAALEAGFGVESEGECFACENNGTMYGPQGRNVVVGCTYCECTEDGWVCTANLCNPCGGAGNVACTNGTGPEYCQYPAADPCGEDGSDGECFIIPTDCAESLPEVCGCDGVTYDDRCAAAAAGQSVRTEGACE